MSQLATIYGGSGFVGKYIARQLAAKGWRIRVAVRRPNEAMHVKPYGTPGQVEPVLCNIRDDASVAAAMQGADAVINCVGVLNAVGKNSFETIHHEGAERIARIAAAQGITTMVHLSAICGESDSDYAKTKALGEQGVLQHMPSAIILRPSVIFGTEDGFFNRFAFMSRFGPVLPLVGANTMFQPVYIEDVARAAVMGAEGAAEAGIYELGGPEAADLRSWVNRMLEVIHRRRLVINLPFWMARFFAFWFDLWQSLSLGLISNGILTRDQVKGLRHDNVVSESTKTLADLGIKPVATGAVIESYLWRHRPAGQYEAIRDSASNLRA